MWSEGVEGEGVEGEGVEGYEERMRVSTQSLLHHACPRYLRCPCLPWLCTSAPVRSGGVRSQELQTGWTGSSTGRPGRSHPVCVCGGVGGWVCGCGCVGVGVWVGVGEQWVVIG